MLHSCGVDGVGRNEQEVEMETLWKCEKLLVTPYP
jgi:hypothetical protein